MISKDKEERRRDGGRREADGRGGRHQLKSTAGSGESMDYDTTYLRVETWLDIRRQC